MTRPYEADIARVLKNVDFPTIRILGAFADYCFTLGYWDHLEAVLNDGGEVEDAHDDHQKATEKLLACDIPNNPLAQILILAAQTNGISTNVLRAPKPTFPEMMDPTGPSSEDCFHAASLLASFDHLTCHWHNKGVEEAGNLTSNLLKERLSEEARMTSGKEAAE